MTTSFRVDLVAGYTTMMQAFITANPTNLRRHFRVRPPSTLNDLPYSYLDLRPEAADHVSGLRTREMNPSVVIVFQIADNGETMDLMDQTVDLLWDHFTSYPHIIPGSWWSRMTANDEAEGNRQDRIAVRFTWEPLSFADPRN